MTKRTWLFRFITTLFILGLAACGGSGGGGGGGGGSGIPTATNAAIAPPPTTPVAISNNGGAGTSMANQTIAANGFQAAEGALENAANPASGLVAQADGSGTRETLGAIVRRHAEKLKDHRPSVTGALQVVDSHQCTGGGTDTSAFDDGNQSATEVFVNCNEGGMVKHGTLSSSNISVVENLGSTVGSPYVMAVTASLTLDLSVTTAAPARTIVTQGSFTFTFTLNGNMVANGTGGVQPGPATSIALTMGGASLLTLDGTVHELLSNFGISVVDNVNTSTSTLSGSFTYASTAINGSVMVNINGALTFQPQGAQRPSSGQVTITSSASPGKITLTVISVPAAGVRVDVFANASGPVTDTVNLTWAQVDAL
jgi:hypothetical protein